MLKPLSVMLAFLLIAAFVLGCEEKQERRDSLKVADAPSTTVAITGPGTVNTTVDNRKSIEKETLNLEKDLDSLSKDIDDFGDFGLDSAASAMDRELDGF
jgi:hypothetical protein